MQKLIQQRRAKPDIWLMKHHVLNLQTIIEQGFITDRDYSKLTDRTKATRTLDLGIIAREGRGRATYYRRS